MTIRAFAVLSVLGCCLFVAVRSAPADPGGVSPAKVADYIHAVIEADRIFYTVHVVERLQRDGGVQAREDWRARKDALPLPAQFLLEASDLAAKTGTEVRYRLISLTPINPQNAPASASEKAGLQRLASNPDSPSTATVTIGGQPYFQAIYADRAVTQACVACHNSHPGSAKKDYKKNDLLGGLVIEIPLGK